MKPILDPCCGSRSFYFNKKDERVIYGDIRRENHTLCDGRLLTVSPDHTLDFRSLPFGDNLFSMVVFDPPHLIHAGEKSWLAAKYGVLSSDWRDDLKKGFNECFRVLKPGGSLIFKWAEIQIKVSEILALTPFQPVIGHRSGKSAKTHWICFLKPEDKAAFGVID